MPASIDPQLVKAIEAFIDSHHEKQRKKLSIDLLATKFKVAKSAFSQGDLKEILTRRGMIKLSKSQTTPFELGKIDAVLAQQPSWERNEFQKAVEFPLDKRVLDGRGVRLSNPFQGRTTTKEGWLYLSGGNASHFYAYEGEKNPPTTKKIGRHAEYADGFFAGLSPEHRAYCAKDSYGQYYVPVVLIDETRLMFDASRPPQTPASKDEIDELVRRCEQKSGTKRRAATQKADGQEERDRKTEVLFQAINERMSSLPGGWNPLTLEHCFCQVEETLFSGNVLRIYERLGPRQNEPVLDPSKIASAHNNECGLEFNDAGLRLLKLPEEYTVASFGPASPAPVRKKTRASDALSSDSGSWGNFDFASLDGSMATYSQTTQSDFGNLLDPNASAIPPYVSSKFDDFLYGYANRAPSGGNLDPYSGALSLLSSMEPSPSIGDSPSNPGSALILHPAHRGGEGNPSQHEDKTDGILIPGNPAQCNRVIKKCIDALRGNSAAQIAKMLGIGNSTIEGYFKNPERKLVIPTLQKIERHIKNNVTDDSHPALKKLKEDFARLRLESSQMKRAGEGQGLGNQAPPSLISSSSEQRGSDLQSAGSGMPTGYNSDELPALLPVQPLSWGGLTEYSQTGSGFDSSASQQGGNHVYGHGYYTSGDAASVSQAPTQSYFTGYQMPASTYPPATPLRRDLDPYSRALSVLSMGASPSMAASSHIPKPESGLTLYENRAGENQHSSGQGLERRGNAVPHEETNDPSQTELISFTEDELRDKYGEIVRKCMKKLGENYKFQIAGMFGIGENTVQTYFDKPQKRFPLNTLETIKRNVNSKVTEKSFPAFKELKKDFEEIHLKPLQANTSDESPPFSQLQPSSRGHEASVHWKSPYAGYGYNGSHYDPSVPQAPTPYPGSMPFGQNFDFSRNFPGMPQSPNSTHSQGQSGKGQSGWGGQGGRS